MDSARRHRYLQKLGIDTWRLRGREAAPAATVEEPAVAAAPEPVSRPLRTAAMPPPPPPRPAVAVGPPPVTLSLIPSRDVPADWEGLRAAVKDCTACKLCRTRTNTVFGVGSETSPLMVVGEGPGADEDAQGEPFVGRAGKLLDEMLKAIGRSRKQSEGEQAREQTVYIANVVKCRPPGNRDPEADEVDACRPYLDRQIELVKPRLIVALGRVAAQRLLATDAPLSRLRGPMHRYGPTQTPVLVTYHPAYLLRSPREKSKSWEDLKKIYRLLAEPV